MAYCTRGGSRTRPGARYVRVLCVDNGSEMYNGEHWFEKIDGIFQVNGEEVEGKVLTLEKLKSGDKIKYKYNCKEWNGIVDDDLPTPMVSEPSASPSSTQPLVSGSKLKRKSDDEPSKQPVKRRKTNGKYIHVTTTINSYV